MIETEQAYLTLWGDISFEEFYQHTKGSAAKMLIARGIHDPFDVDDCLQEAYLNIWQKLQTNPEMFAEKSLGYLIQSLYFASKTQRSRDRQYQRKTSDLLLDEFENTAIIPERLDLWIDLQSAICATLSHIENSEIALFALYSLITLVKVTDIQELLGCSRKTLSNHRQAVRELLMFYLPNYADVPNYLIRIGFAPELIASVLFSDLSI